MHFFNLLWVAQLSSIVSGLQFTNSNFANITIDMPFNITWSAATGSTTLTLVQGGTYPFSKDVLTIASNVSASNYLWTPTATTVRDIYSIRFEDSAGNRALGFQFELLTPASEATPAVVAAAAAATTYATVWSYS